MTTPLPRIPGHCLLHAPGPTRVPIEPADPVARLIATEGLLQVQRRLALAVHAAVDAWSARGPRRTVVAGGAAGGLGPFAGWACRIGQLGDMNDAVILDAGHHLAGR